MLLLLLFGSLALGFLLLFGSPALLRALLTALFFWRRRSAAGGCSENSAPPEPCTAPLGRSEQSAASEHCYPQHRTAPAEHCTAHCYAVVVSWSAARDGSLHTIIGAPAEVQYRMSLLSKELLAKSLRAEEAGAKAGGPALQVKLYCTYLRMSLHASLHTSDLSPPSSPSLAFLASLPFDCSRRPVIEEQRCLSPSVLFSYLSYSDNTASGPPDEREL